MTPQISIIIVHYKVKKLVFDCVWSILKVKSNVKYEIIVVDNDEKKEIYPELIKKFPLVVYIKSPGNIGYGAGMNLGAKYAKGKYLYILNSDTVILPGSLDNLVNFLDKHDDYAIAAPQLLDKKHHVYELQGVRRLTFLRAIFALTFINKFLPNNLIAKNYWMKKWDKKQIKNVDVVPGTAFVIKKDIYEKTGGFDENFFLYFEEFDLCNRVKDLGYKIGIIPSSKIIHLWGQSTKLNKQVNKIFIQSRRYYFSKYYGRFLSWILEKILNFSLVQTEILLILLIVIGIRVYNLPKTTFFIGDQAWFYLSARDLLISHIIPLVGITSSHVWLHQGPLWTYILAIGLLFSNFNPLSGAVISLITAVATTYLLYKIGKCFVSNTVGIFAALFYAISPLAIMFDRMPYHTTLIPLSVALFVWCTLNWLNNKINYFPWVIFMLAILYNLEISTSLFFMVIGFLMFYGYRKRMIWWIGLNNERIKIKSLILFIIPMSPMLIYDFGHGFPQTFGYLAWVVYKVSQIFSLHHSRNIINSIEFLVRSYYQTVFPTYSLIGEAIGLFSLIYLIYLAYRQKSIFLIVNLFILTTLVLGFISGGVNSEAYLPMFLPIIFLIEAYLFFNVGLLNKYVKPVLFVIMIVIAIFNIKASFTEVPFYPVISYANRLQAAKEIIRQTENSSYSLIGTGEGSQFASFTMNMQYLTWWLGKPEEPQNAKIEFIINENHTLNVTKVIK